MKRFLTAAIAATALAVPSMASAQGPGQAIKSACGTSFGQLVSSFEPGFQLGQHQKGVAQGGAAAFAAPAVLGAHGCTG